MSKRGSKGYAILFCVFLLMLVGNLLYWGKRKEGFFGDELYSYHYVNQIEYPYITEDRGTVTWMNSWHPSDYFRDYLTIDKTEAFDIYGTYQSITRDVHPPVFYILLEMLCSVFSWIFPGAFSKWCGILINIFFLFLSVLVLYRLARELCGSKGFAFAVCILYGFSVGAVSTAVFLRMYAIFTFASVLFLYMNTLLWREMRPDRHERNAAAYMGLCFSVILGILNHYYFFVFAFFACAFIWICSLIMKKYRFAIKYALTMAIGILGSYFLWPDMKNDIFSGYRGEEAFDNFAGSMSWGAVKEFFTLIDAELFGGCGGIFIFVLLCILLYRFVSLRWRIGGRQDGEGGFFVTLEKREAVRKMELRFRYSDQIALQILFTVLFYILVISKIAPYREDRYIFNTFPMVSLLAVYAVKRLSADMPDSRRLRVGVFVMLAAFTAMGYLTPGVNYLYKGTEDKLETADLYSDLPVFYLNNGSTFRACGDSVYFSKAYAVYPLSPEAGTDDFAEALEQLKKEGDGEASRCLVYIDLDIPKTDGILNCVKQALHASEVRALFQTEYSAVYIAE